MHFLMFLCKSNRMFVSVSVLPASKEKSLLENNAFHPQNPNVLILKFKVGGRSTSLLPPPKLPLQASRGVSASPIM